MIEAIELTKKYPGVTALDTLNLKIEPGEIFCLLGANGAGKTTTIHLFLGFIIPTSGRATIGGLEVHRHALETRRLLAYIPEQVNLYPHLTGLENLRYFAELAGRRKVTRHQLLEVLERVHLGPPAIDRKVATYSKGMRQKIGIAIALAKEARVLFLDEPLSGLDPQAANELCTLLTALRGQGAAVLMATHDLLRARRVGDRLGIMQHGVLVAHLTATAFDPANIEHLYLEDMSQ